MIDIIILENSGKNITKTLLSIYMQTKIDIINIYIFSPNKKLNSIEKYFSTKKQIIKIKYTGQTEKEIINKYNSINNKAKYVFFIRENDIIYNALSIEILQKEITNNDIIIGTMLTNIKGTICSSNYQKCLYGKLYNTNNLKNYQSKKYLNECVYVYNKI